MTGVRLRHSVEEWMEGIVLNAADRIIVVTETMQAEMRRKFPHIEPTRFAVITNGFDSEDFLGIVSQRENSGFTLTHTGTLWAQGALKSFLDALVDLPKDQKLDTKVVFLGGLYQKDIDLISELGLSRLVDVKPFVTHTECLSCQAGSDALLLFVPSWYTAAYSGKIFEYLLAKKPILAMVPDGEAAALIKETGAGLVVHPEDTEGIKRGLIKLYEMYKMGTLGVNGRSLASVQRFERRELTRQLAGVFEEELSRGVK
jgi:glycosyltransferase involved in cell wall biosynthesis